MALDKQGKSSRETTICSYLPKTLAFDATVRGKVYHMLTPPL
jgi:hypothetical protein